MSGEIHGLISREDAWRMWKPYGERVDLDGSVDPATLTNQDALQIVIGADTDTQGQAYGYWYDENDQRKWYAGIEDVDLQGEPELVDLLITSQEKQQKNAERSRARAIEGGLDFTKKLGQSVLKLRQEGLLTSSQTDSINNWLIAPDGLPYIQYTPMSRLEYARLGVKYDKELPSENSSDCTDFSLGILRSVSGSYPRTTTHTQHNKIHESVHGSVSGVEIHDITRVDGWRHPDATVLGVFAYDPSTEIFVGDDYSDVENVEISEGWTDFITRQLIRVEPSLGKENKDAGGYTEWANGVQELRSKNQALYDVITEAMLVEEKPSNPGNKRQALADMHEYADRVLATPNALEKLFLSNGGSILDIYTKGKKTD